MHQQLIETLVEGTMYINGGKDKGTGTGTKGQGQGQRDRDGDEGTGTGTKGQGRGQRDRDGDKGTGTETETWTGTKGHGHHMDCTLFSISLYLYSTTGKK